MFSGIPYQITGNPQPSSTYNQNVTDKLAVAPADMNYDPATGIVTFSNPVLGSSATTLVGFHGAAGTARRASVAQAAVITTAATQSTPYGFATQAQADAIVTLVNELRAFAVEKNLIKGSA